MHSISVRSQNMKRLSPKQSHAFLKLGQFPYLRATPLKDLIQDSQWPRRYDVSHNEKPCTRHSSHLEWRDPLDVPASEESRYTRQRFLLGTGLEHDMGGGVWPLMKKASGLNPWTKIQPPSPSSEWKKKKKIKQNPHEDQCQHRKAVCSTLRRPGGGRMHQGVNTQGVFSWLRGVLRPPNLLKCYSKLIQPVSKSL